MPATIDTPLFQHAATSLCPWIANSTIVRGLSYQYGHTVYPLYCGE
jgi:hypothetical protein